MPPLVISTTPRCKPGPSCITSSNDLPVQGLFLGSRAPGFPSGGGGGEPFERALAGWPNRPSQPLWSVTGPVSLHDHLANAAAYCPQSVHGARLAIPRAMPPRGILYECGYGRIPPGGTPPGGIP